ncbi:pantoate--beta-alanine ligase [Alteribacillus sp. HJP-4]|uniref:pantoate--beta-alanine ligase n=1 Tax=Alteribacillus sp. HJP-4 TaxID=2775394 RepID=UPI0035CD19B8
MKTFISPIELTKTLLSIKSEKKTIGFVPTMGSLHEGHLELVKKAKQQNDVVIISVFVNPLQFGAGEDYNEYPRSIERDRSLAEQAGVDLFFEPTEDLMYPEKLNTSIVVESGTNVLCGKSRPGHFDGVATVVMKLFQIVQPDRSYFGLKDAQQVAVIKNMVKDFHMPVSIVACDIVREADGLALSSRNIRLSENERYQAPALYKALQYGAELLSKSCRSPEDISRMVYSHVSERIEAKIDYIDILSFPALSRSINEEDDIILAGAVHFKKARLIDNILVPAEIRQKRKLGI